MTEQIETTWDTTEVDSKTQCGWIKSACLYRYVSWIQTVAESTLEEGTNL